jgi:hypothetical protein
MACFESVADGATKADTTAIEEHPTAIKNIVSELVCRTMVLHLLVQDIEFCKFWNDI